MTLHSRLLLHSLRHTRPSQLVQRARLQIKRRWMAGTARFATVPRKAPQREAALRDPLPGCVFARRTALVERVGAKVFLTMLNRRDPFALPFDWRPERLARGTYLERLNFHYMEFLEAFSDAEFAAAVEDWIAANPRYMAGYWRDAWNSYALSIRAVVWMQQYADRAAALSADFRTRMLASLVDQLQFLCSNLELDIGGNHLIKNVKALLWGAAFMSGPCAARWGELGRALLTRALQEQILPDGMHFELSPAYHAQVFADLLECRTALTPGALRDALDGALDRMAHALAMLTHPDGRISLFNDGGLHMTYQPAELLGAYARVRQRQVAVADGPLVLASSGYLGLRARGGYVLFDCGAIGPDYLPAHAHGDILAFEWSIGARRIIVDTGVFEYHPGVLRDASRATASHNTVTLDGRDQGEFWKAFRVGRRGRGSVESAAFAGDHFDIAGRHNGFAWMKGAPIHFRRMHGTTRAFAVEDRIDGGRGQLAEARLLFPAGCVLVQSGDSVTARCGDLVVRITGSVQPRVEDTEWYPDFGVRETARRLVFRYGRAPCRGGFSLAVL